MFSTTLARWILASTCMAQLVASLQSILSLDGENPRSPDYRPKVAIVGGGISGASSAFYLQELARFMPAPPLITLFEQSSNFGGRVDTTGAHHDLWQAVDLGAVAFSSNDRCMQGAASEVGLVPQPYIQHLGQTGIWDGKNITTQASAALRPETWSEYFRSLWKYGLAPKRARQLIDRTQKNFALFLEPILIRNVTENLARHDLLSIATTSAQSLFTLTFGQESAFVFDVLSPLVRARLSADLNEITALAGLVAISPNDLFKIPGGNWRLLNRLIQLSEADVRTNTRAIKLSQSSSSGWLLHYATNDEAGTATGSQGFDFVIIATSLQESGIEISQTSSSLQLPGNHLVTSAMRHVTYFSFPGFLSSEAFGQEPSTQLPGYVLTTPPGAGEFGVYSIGITDRIVAADIGDCFDENEDLENLYRIVSKISIPDQEIARLLGKSLDETVSLDSLGVTWVERRSWPHAFRPFDGRHLLEESQLIRGIYYSAATDDIASSLELSCMTGKKAAEALFYDRMVRDPWA